MRDPKLILLDHEQDLCRMAQASIRAGDGKFIRPGLWILLSSGPQGQRAGGSGGVGALRPRCPMWHSTEAQRDRLIEAARRYDGDQAGSAAAVYLNRQDVRMSR